MNNRDHTNEQLKAELQQLQSAFDLLKSTRENELQDHTRAIYELSKQENYFRNIYQNAPVKYQLLNADTRLIDVNPAWLNSLGYLYQEVIGLPFDRFVTAKSAVIFKEIISDSTKHGYIHNAFCELIHKNGTVLPVNLHVSVEPDEKGDFKQLHCVWTEIARTQFPEDADLVKDWAIESAINAIAISDLAGNITYVNPAFYKMWEYTLPEDVIGKPAIGFWQAGEKASEVIHALQQEGGWIGELAALNKNGEAFDVQISASMVKDLDGNPFCMLGSFADISKRKRAEKLQAENEISYRELFNSVTDAIYIQDEEGTFLDVNEGALKMYGYLREELIGKNPLFVSAPGKNDLDAIARMSKSAFAGTPQHFEFWGLRSNGEIFPKEVRLMSGSYFGKKVNIAMAQDITERKKAETALLDSERRYRELIELAVDGILLGSPAGTIIGANTYMLTLTGRSLENLIGINISEIFSPNALKNAPFRYDLLKKGETVFSERDILRADGKIIPIEMHTKMMPDGSYQSIYRDVTERTRAEEMLRKSEEKYKSLVENTSDIIWETDAAGLYLYLSPQFERILGYTTDEALGKSPYDFISEDLLSEINARADLDTESTSPFYLLVNKFRHRSGQIVYFETSGVPVYNDQGVVSGYRGVSRDVTKRHLAEKELHKLSLVVHQSPNTIIITDLQGKMEYINPAGCSFSGYEYDELIGKKPSIFSSHETPEETYRSLWETIKAGNEWKGAFLNKKKNGELFWESAFIVPLKDAEGTITHYLGVKEDISKRIEAEDALRESEERYRELFEASPDAIILADIATGMLIDANMAACTMLGRTLSEIQQLHQTMIHPSRYEEFSAESFRVHSQKNSSNENQQAIESFILKSDGTEIPVEVLSNKITIKGRQILQGVFRNITERKQAREELMKAKEKAEASDKLKSAFLHNISHELRTPLNGIIGFSEMITQMDNSEDDRIEFSKMIRKSSSRLINTITSYMDISMIVSGITEPTKSSFSLRNFLDKINDQTIEFCQSANLQLNIFKKSSVEDMLITTDETLLAKIFFHLIDNAIKFTKAGAITIGHEYNGEFHQFSVSDTGTGISNDSLPVIFEIFMQADFSASRAYEGSGLGLSITRGFIKLLGGDIWVESSNEEGSTFIFTIPDKDAKLIVKREIENSVEKLPPVEELVILIAEDEDSNYKYLEIVLKKASFKVLRAINGFETVEICHNHPEINVLLMDLKMPGMDGFEATRQIRRFMPELPIIVLSAFMSPEDENTAKIAGCNDYLVKPVSKLKLLETINKVLDSVKN